MSGRITWEVPTHQPLRELAPGLWTVDAQLQGPPIGRRMIVARRADGSLVVHSAVCADEATMATLAAAGPIATIVVPNGYHRLDAAAFKHRFGAARVLAPAGSRAKVEKKVHVDDDATSLGDDGQVGWVPLAGCPAEGLLLHHGPDGLTAVFNDAFMNLPDKLPGVQGFMMKLLGSTGGPKVTRIARWFLIENAVAHAAQLRALAERPDLVRVVPGHGAILEGAEARAGLRRAAELLAPEA